MVHITFEKQYEFIWFIEYNNVSIYIYIICEHCDYIYELRANLLAA